MDFEIFYRELIYKKAAALSTSHVTKNATNVTSPGKKKLADYAFANSEPEPCINELALAVAVFGPVGSDILMQRTVRVWLHR
ncbi:MAG: hypothetical protein ACOY90_15710 [Candidatus Zhuqueibacterota bacterium]